MAKKSATKSMKKPLKKSVKKSVKKSIKKKPKEGNRRNLIATMVSPGEQAAIDVAAKKKGQTRAAFLRSSALKAC